MLGSVRDRIRHNVGGFMADRQAFVWFLALLIGLGVAYAAIAFRLTIGLVQVLWLGTVSESVVSYALHTPWWVIMLAPALGGLVVGLILEHCVAGRRAHGVADVIEARAVGNCRIDTRTGLWSALLAAISLGSGASAGREGPVVHLGATLASFVEDRFSLSQGARRTLLACGVSAAVAASFNAPIAGVLFAHEVILAHYALRAFVPIVISSVAASLIARIHLGNFPAFIVPRFDISSYWEFPAFALLGVTCAIVAILFQVALMTTERVAWRVDIPLWLRPVVGGLMVGALGVAYPQILGVGYEATDMALKQQLPIALLVSLVVFKTAATAITLASRFAGGIFSPALYLGAMTGSAFGLIAASAFPEMASAHGLYALLGMGAVAAAVLGAPISTTLIVFELTGGYEMTIALLLTVSIAVGISGAVHGQSFFHWQLEKRGFSLQEGPHKEIMRSMRVSSFMVDLAVGERQPTAPDGKAVPWLMPGDTLEQALRTFDRAGLQRIAVVSERDERVVIGWVDRVAAISAFNAALIESHREEHR